jgi:thiol:disulfide interchange protein DsbA
MMDRRRFSLQLAGTAGAASLAVLGILPATAGAQAAPVAGKDYSKVDPPAPTSAPAGKIDVIEFFWYGCPHCYDLEPLIEPWIAKLPADVQFRLVPFDFGEALREIHQRIFCTWEVLGLVEKMHKKTFDRFHRERKPINTEQDMLAFAADSGLDVAKVKAAWNSFGVQVKMRQAKQTCDQYGVHSTPLLAVQGRFETEPAMAGSGDKALAVTDWLINQVRKGV